jgi:hypothetical protein
VSVSERGNVSLVDGCEDIMRNSAGSFPLNNSGADLVRFIWFMHMTSGILGESWFVSFFFFFFSSLF